MNPKRRLERVTQNRVIKLITGNAADGGLPCVGSYALLLKRKRYRSDPTQRIMTQQEHKKPKDLDLAGSFAAMQHAARMAREIAVRTDTAIIVTRNQQLVRVTVEELRKEEVS